MRALLAGVQLASDTGMAVTQSEAEALNLSERAEFAHAAATTVIAHARRMATFGGAYVDQPSGGGIVILLTRITPEAVAELRAREPMPTLGLEIREVTHTQESLRQAVTDVWEAWSDIGTGVELYSAAVDVPGNRVELEVDHAALARVAGVEAQLASTLSVPVVLRGGEKAEPAAQTCTSVHRCYSPTEAGTFIRQDLPSGVNTCTMGFHITVGSNEQFLTSDHCGWGSSSYWYQLYGPGWGNEAGTLFSNYGDDVMKVEIADTQASDWIYGEPHTFHAGGYRDPVYGEYICAYLPKQLAEDCGTVADDFLSYSLTDSSKWETYVMYGADASGMTAIGGDSGAPVYAPVGSQAVALGVMSDTAERFGLLSETLPIWGATVY